jgi:cytoskeleton protein RodZ
MPEIGATLREARMHAHIDVSEIEAQTKIRAKYLRALENEEWGLLPGPTFVKSFLRTYAQALGLDGKALVEEYRLHHERPSEAMLEPIVTTPQGSRSRSRGRAPSSGPSRGYLAAVLAIVAVIVLLVVLLVSGGSSSHTPTTATVVVHTHRPRTHHHAQAPIAAGASSIVALSLKPTAPVYVCLIGEDGHKLIPGEELQAGTSTPTYHARHFAIRLGNNSLTMFIDGRPRTVSPSAEPIGYSISKARGRQPLSSSELPSCQ